MKLWVALNTLGMRKTFWLIPSAAITLFSLAVVFCGMQPCVGNDATRGFRLGISRVASTGKPCFILNGQPFYPILYSVHCASLTPRALNDLRQQGFNALQVAVDTEEVAAPSFRKLMSLCSEANLPVFLEIHEWSFWDVLRRRPELNMVMSHGQRVEHFPDYANPKTRRLHLDRYRQAAKNIVPFLNRPIVAVSVGAYDAYHLPDDERHADFSVPRHDQPIQTRLPYGRWSQDAFQQYLASFGVNRTSFGGVASGESVELPTTNADALSEDHWQYWIHYRRNLVSSWLRQTVETVRQQTGLLVGVSLDLKFAQRERFATPLFQWSGFVDFASVYCYGGKSSKRRPHRLPLMREDYDESDAEYVPDLMRTAFREFSQAGVPLIGFLEFSSALAGDTPGDAYARQCAPFVSGLMTTAPHPKLKHDRQRVDSFVGWVVAQGGSASLLQRTPASATVLAVVNRHRIYSDHSAERELSRHKIPFDVHYATTDWDGSHCDEYECVVVDHDLPIPASDKTGDVVFLREAELPTWILNKVETQ